MVSSPCCKYNAITFFLKYTIYSKSCCDFYLFETRENNRSGGTNFYLGTPNCTMEQWTLLSAVNLCGCLKLSFTKGMAVVALHQPLKVSIFCCLSTDGFQIKMGRSKFPCRGGQPPAIQVTTRSYLQLTTMLTFQVLPHSLVVTHQNMPITNPH